MQQLAAAPTSSPCFLSPHPCRCLRRALSLLSPPPPPLPQDLQASHGQLYTNQVQTKEELDKTAANWEMTKAELGRTKETLAVSGVWGVGGWVAGWVKGLLGASGVVGGWGCRAVAHHLWGMSARVSPGCLPNVLIPWRRATICLAGTPSEPT
jgi:hypothetical protein